MHRLATLTKACSSWLPAVLLGLLFCVSMSGAKALDLLQLSIQDSEFSGLKFNGLTLDLELNNDVPTLLISIEAVQINAQQRLTQLHLRCPLASMQSHLQVQLIECSDADFSVKSSSLGQLSGKLDLRFDQATEQLSLRLDPIQHQAGSIRLDAQLDQADWNFHLTAKDLDVAQIKKIAARFIDLEGLSSDESGRIDLSIHGRGSAAELASARIKVNLRKLNFYASSIAEDLQASLDLSIQKKSRQWQIEGQTELLAGVLYLELGDGTTGQAPGFFLEPQKQPIQLSFQLNHSDKQLGLEELILSHPGVLSAHVTAQIEMGDTVTLQALKTTINSADLGKAFPVYLQPLLINSNMTDLELTGQSRLKLTLDDQGVSDLDLSLKEVYAEDQQGRFHIAGLDGKLRFNNKAEPLQSELKWQGATIYKIALGESLIKLSSHGRSMQLQEQVSIPVFDGSLQIDSLEIQNIGLADFAVDIDSQLQPISLSEISELFSWPIMVGNISGTIPGAHFQQGDLAVAGELHVKVFDGDIRMSDLRLNDLFGLVPRLYADLEINDLDLALLTQVFEFGEISGRLDGYLRDAQFDDWQPVKFEASFYTPEDDNSRHRISQRAIDNITNIGGGGAGTNAVSRGLLGLFEDFPYASIGLSCRLVDGTCFMDGVEPSDDGYYIVKHGLLPPWLDIKGYNREVNWLDLLNRLKTISKTDEVVVK